MSGDADWAGQAFEAVKFTIPSEADFMAEAAHQYQALRLLRAVLARDDKRLATTAAAEPAAHLDLVDWFDGLAADLEANAKRLRQASARLLAALSRIEAAGR
ncbi:hypothetical protein [Acidocella facilis]|uniref:hypothetical protein n=1 Tax=Acidocella facilis TaxID=525 RepID=UPI001F3EC99F|nr:hypothetical protein [Acidocella facilis]